MLRPSLLLSLGGVLLVASASASAANPVTATLTTSTTEPVIGEPWRYSITVRDEGKPLEAKVRLQILRGKVVVGCWKSRAIVRCSGSRAGSWIAFRGRRTATIVWPAFAGPGKLVFRAVLVTDSRTLRLRAPVLVQPRPSA